MAMPVYKMCNIKCKRACMVTAILLAGLVVIYTVSPVVDRAARDGAVTQKQRQTCAQIQAYVAADMESTEILEMVRTIKKGKGEENKEDIDVKEMGVQSDETFKNKNDTQSADIRTEIAGGEVIGCDTCGEPQNIPDILPTKKHKQARGKHQTPQTSDVLPRLNQTKGEHKYGKRNWRSGVRQQKDFPDLNEEARYEIMRIQAKRKERVETVCKNSPQLKHGDRLYRDTYQHLFVIESQKLLFCYIPKVACSNWKRILMVLSGKRNWMEGISSREAHARNGLTRFSSLSMSAQQLRLQTYRKVMFVREPFTRIVSAFKNKYRDLDVFRSAPQNLQQYARKIMRKYRRRATRRELATGENITWAEFTDYLTDPSEQPTFDEHWRESYKLCSPCEIKYDFIGKLENIADEANFILQSYNFTKKLTYPSSNNSHPTNTGSGSISDYFTGFSDDKLQALWDIYRFDYELFDYTKPSFIP